MARGRRAPWAERGSANGSGGGGGNASANASANANGSGGGGGGNANANANGNGGGGGRRHRDRGKDRERDRGDRDRDRAGGGGGGAESSSAAAAAASPGGPCAPAAALPRQPEDREAGWANCTRFDEAKHHLNISMCGWGLTDQDIAHWVAWFGRHAATFRGGLGLPTGEHAPPAEVDFAENRLTNAGIKVLLEAMLEAGVAARRLKLHHNRLSSSQGVAEFLKNCRGTLHELHLSHNDLDTAAAAQIVLAAAAARDEQGRLCYPRSEGGGRGAAPLWLRLEQNFINHAQLLQSVADGAPELNRTGWVMCNATNKGCTPHSCARHRHDPAAIHAKQLANQRTPRAATLAAQAAQAPAPPARAAPPAGAPPPPAAAGEGRAATPPARPARARESPKGPPGSPQSSAPRGGATEATTTPKASSSSSSSGAAEAREENQADTTLVRILRWDEKEVRWVRDFMEVPTERPVEPGSRRIKPETAASMAKELKSLIGIKPRSAADAGSGAKTQPQTTSQQRDDSASELAANGEHILRMVTAKGSRRGLQPSGSEVKQANGTPLNRQAQEFVPDAAARLPARLPARPSLNPQAAEFTPQGSAALAAPTGPVAKRYGEERRRRLDEEAAARRGAAGGAAAAAGAAPAHRGRSPERQGRAGGAAPGAEAAPAAAQAPEPAAPQPAQPAEAAPAAAQAPEPAAPQPAQPAEAPQPAAPLPAKPVEAAQPAPPAAETAQACALGAPAAVLPEDGCGSAPRAEGGLGGATPTGGCTPESSEARHASPQKAHRADGCIPGCAGGLAAACNRPEDGERSIPKRVGSMLVASAAVALTTVAAAVAKRGRK